MLHELCQLQQRTEWLSRIFVFVIPLYYCAAASSVYDHDCWCIQRRRAATTHIQLRKSQILMKTVIVFSLNKTFGKRSKILLKCKSCIANWENEWKEKSDWNQLCRLQSCDQQRGSCNFLEILSCTVVWLHPLWFSTSYSIIQQR